MKRTLVLAILLSVVSTVNAGLTFSVPSVMVYVGDPVVISLLADSGTSGSSSDTSFVGGVGASLSFAAGAVSEALTVNPQAAYPGYYQLISGTTDGAYVLGDEVVEMYLSELGVGTYTIYLFTATGWNTNYTTTDSMTVLIGVPEPMTIGLLGIGGLLLRRRK